MLFTALSSDLFLRDTSARDQETLKIFLLSAAQRNENQIFPHFSRVVRWLINEWRRRRVKISDLIFTFFIISMPTICWRASKILSFLLYSVVSFTSSWGLENDIMSIHTSKERSDRGERRKTPSVFRWGLARLFVCWRAIFSLIQKFSLLLFI